MAFPASRSGASSEPSRPAMVRLERGLSNGTNGNNNKPASNGNGNPNGGNSRSKPSPPPSTTPTRGGRRENGARVRVAVRLRPRNADEKKNDADFADYIELSPELKRLKLRKNNWDCETYQFDEILNQNASQKRVYEVVAKPVVESVLEGYNGTVMAYGQTGTGKTFTLGKLGEEDVAERGIMVRAMEDILRNTSPETDLVSVSYLQLYMETVQDLLAPEKDNIAIAEDQKTGDVSLPGATSVEVRDHDSFIQLLQTGEANRFAANTKMNTESSRSHAILLVNVKKTVDGKQERENENSSNVQQSVSMIRRSKLLIVDLAGSERVDKSGSEGLLLKEANFINLSLTALGKCINALAQNSPHVPFRDSRLTRLLRDSFGGSARTSLIITIGPSPQHRAETTSTILFGQRAMKVENMMKLREEFDYQSLSKKLEGDVENLTAENERLRKSAHDANSEKERKVEETKQKEKKLEELAAEIKKNEMKTRETISLLETKCSKLEKDLEMANTLMKDKESAMAREILLQHDRATKQKELEDCIVEYQLKLAEMTKKFESEHVQREILLAKLMDTENQIKDKDKNKVDSQGQVLSLRQQIEESNRLREEAERNLLEWKSKTSATSNEESMKLSEQVRSLKLELEEQKKQKEQMESEVRNLKQQMLMQSYDVDETRRFFEREPSRTSFGSESTMSLNRPNHVREAINGQRATIAKLFEQVGLNKILALLESEDIDVRIHAVKVVANLAAEESNQEKIVQAGGLGSLLKLLQSSEDETIRRVAAGAIANLAMNETNQELIMDQSGIKLLSKTANEAEDPQTLRMVAGAIANLCGNDKLQEKLREEGGIKALRGMVRSEHPDVLAQIARGIANFAKCESRAAQVVGQRKGRSLLIEDGALQWVVENANTDASSVRRHLELALCHLAQHEVNADDLVKAGALWEIVRIAKECSREDIRNLARRTLTASSTFQSELRKLRLSV